MKNWRKRQREVLERSLERLIDCGLTDGFYLTGGTALFFRYGHRPSEDLDFFSLPEKAEENFPAQRLFRKLSGIGKVELHTEDTVIAEVEGVMVSFFSYPYPLLEPPCPLEIAEGKTVWSASDADIAASKLIAVAHRGAKKDFFDLHFLLEKNRWSIEYLLSLCRRKYSLTECHQGFLIKALTYFEDAEGEKTIGISHTEWEKVKDYFREQVKRLCSIPPQP